MNNALRTALITWFQQLPAIVVTLLPRDPLSRLYIYLWLASTQIVSRLRGDHESRTGTVSKSPVCRRVGKIAKFTFDVERAGTLSRLRVRE